MPTLSPPPASPELDPLRDLPPRIVFYDGLCVFCNRAASWILAHDPRGRFHFAPLQGQTAERLRSRWPAGLGGDLDSVVLLERSDEGELAFLQRSEALRAIVRDLEGFLPALLRPLLAVLPRVLVDLAYDAFARRRTRLFGRLDACPVPPTGARDSRSLP